MWEKFDTTGEFTKKLLSQPEFEERIINATKRMQNPFDMDQSSFSVPFLIEKYTHHNEDLLDTSYMLHFLIFHHSTGNIRYNFRKVLDWAGKYLMTIQFSFGTNTLYSSKEELRNRIFNDTLHFYSPLHGEFVVGRNCSLLISFCDTDYGIN